MNAILNTAIIVGIIALVGVLGTEDYEARQAEAEHTAEIMRDVKIEQQRQAKREERLKYMIAYDRIVAR